MAENKNAKKAAAAVAAAPVVAAKNETPQEMAKATKKVSRWTEATCHKAAKRFTSREAWASNGPSSYKAAAAKGWLDRCCAHMKAAPAQGKAPAPRKTA